MVFIVLYVVWASCGTVGTSDLTPSKIILKMSVNFSSFLSHVVFSIVFNRWEIKAVCWRHMHKKADTDNIRQCSGRHRFKPIDEAVMMRHKGRVKYRVHILVHSCLHDSQGKCVINLFSVMWHWYIIGVYEFITNTFKHTRFYYILWGIYIELNLPRASLKIPAQLQFYSRSSSSYMQL